MADTLQPASTASSTSPAAPTPSKRRALKRILLIAAGVVAVLLIGFVLLIPTIASAVAPGLIASAAAKQIRGTVEVSDVSVGWNGPSRVGSLTLRDESGKVVGSFHAESTLGILSALKGLGDLGTLTLSGKVDLEARDDSAGRAITNLQRAIEPRNPQPKSAASPGSPIPELRVKIDITDLDVTFARYDTLGALLTRAAVNDFKGSASVDTTRASTGNVDATFTAMLSDGVGTSPLDIKVKASKFLTSAGDVSIDTASVDAKVLASKLPTPLIDALAGAQGMISEAMGDQATLDLSAVGTLQQADAALDLKSPNITAAGAIHIAAGKVTVQRPVAAAIASTKFIERIPSLRDALSKAGVQIEEHPRLTLNLAALSLNLPAAGKALDLRGGSVQLNIQATPMRATLRAPVAVVTATSTPQPFSAAAAAARTLQTSNFTLSIASADFAREVTVDGGMTATIDNQPAGVLAIKALARGLVTDTGAINTTPTDLAAELSAKALNLELAQPFVTAAGLPLDLPQDFGPQADLLLSVKTLGEPGALDADVAFTSRDARLTLPIHITKAAIATRGEAQAALQRLTPIVRRVIQTGSEPAALQISGDAPLAAKLSFSVPRLADGSVDALNAALEAHATLGALSVQAAPKAAPAERFDIRTTTLTATKPAGGDARITIDAPITTRAGEAGIKGDLTLVGFAPASTAAAVAGASKGATPVLAAGARPEIVALGTRRIIGALDITKFPTALLSLVGAAADEGTLRLAQDALGPQLEIALKFAETAQSRGQTVTLTASSANLHADGAVSIAADTIDLTGLNAALDITAQTVRAALLKAGFDDAAATTMTLVNPVTATLVIAPVKLPTANGRLDAARIGSQVIALDAKLDRPALVRNLSLSDGQRFNGGIADASLSIKLPAAALLSAEQRAGSTLASTAPRASINGGARLIEEGASQPIAVVAITGDASGDFSQVDAQAKLTGLRTARIDALLSKPGFASGALGETADVTATVKQAGAAAPMDLSLTVASPRLKTSAIKLTSRPDQITLAAPVEVDWQVEPSFLNQTLLKPKPPAPGQAAAPERATTVAETVRVKAQLNALTIARGGDAESGPFRAGAFNIDAALNIPAVALVTQPQAGANAVATTSRLESIVATIKGDAARLEVVAKIEKVSGGSAATTTPLTANATVEHFATRAGKADFDSAIVNLDVSAAAVPTALVEQLTRTGEQIQELLGDSITLKLKARNFALSEVSGAPAIDFTTGRIPSAAAGAPGQIEATFASVAAGDAAPVPAANKPAPAAANANPRTPAANERDSRVQAPNRNATGRDARGNPGASAPTAAAPVNGTQPQHAPQRPQASLDVAGQVRGGVLMIAGQRPLNVSLARFTFGSDKKILGILPLFASIQKTGQGVGPDGKTVIAEPLTITSSNLAIPVDGDMSKLNGLVNVNVGKLDYIFKRELGEFLDAALFSGSNEAQAPIPPFVVNFERGVATYKDVVLPVRNYSFRMEGRVDLIADTIDAVIYVPTIAASASLLGRINDDLGKGFGKVLPSVLSEGTMLPIRATGPMSNPTYYPDVKLFFQNFGSQLVPGEILKGVGGALGDAGKGLGDVGKGIGKGIGDLLNRPKK
ncbi:hypothetical protein BH11PLA1_BH11PLA1_09370 [soil metagenome]